METMRCSALVVSLNDRAQRSVSLRPVSWRNASMSAIGACQQQVLHRGYDLIGAEGTQRLIRPHWQVQVGAPNRSAFAALVRLKPHVQPSAFTTRKVVRRQASSWLIVRWGAVQQLTHRVSWHNIPGLLQGPVVLELGNGSSNTAELGARGEEEQRVVPVIQQANVLQIQDDVLAKRTQLRAVVGWVAQALGQHLCQYVTITARFTLHQFCCGLAQSVPPVPCR